MAMAGPYTIGEPEFVTVYKSRAVGISETPVFQAVMQEQLAGGRAVLIMPRQNGMRSVKEALAEMNQRQATIHAGQTGMTELAQEYAAMQAATAYTPRNRAERRAAERKHRRVDRKV